MDEPRVRSWTGEPVSQEELDDFRKNLQELADREFGVDDEGDSTIEVRLTNRTKERFPRFIDLPYENSLEEAEFNLVVAFDEWDRAVKINRARREREADINGQVKKD